MNMRSFLITVVALGLTWLVVPTARPAPPYPLEALLERAEHVLIVKLTSRTSTNATFEVTEVVRGDDKLRTLTLGHSHAEHEFFKHTSGLLLFSQGDNYWGQPKPIFRIHQPMIGQASYCGWILEGGPAESTSEPGRLRELVKKAPYKPDKYGQKSNKKRNVDNPE